MTSNGNTLPPDTGTFRHVMRMAIPLMLASSGHAIRLVADRIMLAKYSPESLAASMPAGLTSFVLMSFFIGTAGYVNTFIAQYTGAGQQNKIGRAVWHGLYLAALGGIIVAILGQAGPGIFKWMGHAPAVQSEQVRYFRILCRFSAAGIMVSALLSFWSGRGLTYVVMIIELSAAALNVLLNYVLIYGHFGMPRLGITGAAIGTGIASVFGLLMAFVLFMSPFNRKTFGTATRPTIDWALMRRILRFGSPNGMQFTLSIAAFNVFIAFLGRFGTAELEATNMAFGLNACTFIPMVGIGMAVSILVGQCLGADSVSLARRCVRNGIILALSYSVLMGLIFVLVPHVVLMPFRRPGDVAQAATMLVATRCVRYIALYLVFDALYVIFSHAIRGAGDTRFAMTAGLLLSWGTLVLPCVIAQARHASIWTLWHIFVAHIMLAGTVFYLRYRGGKWESMRVIEKSPPPSPLDPDHQTT